MKDTLQEVTRKALVDIAGEHLHDVKTTYPTKNTLGAAIVAASLASTFVEPQRLYAPNVLFRRVFLKQTISQEEQRRKDEASLEAITNAKAKRERKALAKSMFIRS